MSAREAIVVKVQDLIKHENADTLSLMKVGGFQVVLRTEDWEIGSLAVYIQPDEIVDTTKECFSWLRDDGMPHRVKAMRLRGEWSTGLLVKAPDGAKEGDNLYDQLGLVHYEPELNISTKGPSIAGPDCFKQLSKYDIENARKLANSSAFVDGEPIWVSEKLHGANMAFVYDGEKLHVRSRSEWKLEGDNCFWNAINNTPACLDIAKSRPGWLFYGECIGVVQKGFPYDAKGTVKFRCFDILKPDMKFMDAIDFVAFCNFNNLPMVPSLGFHTFNIDKLITMAERRSELADHIAEGIVIKTSRESYDNKLGRKILKIVSNSYLEKS